jgi:hypothetical protein
MSEREQVDLTHYSFDEFISFLFAREVEVKSENVDEEKHDQWFWHIEDTFIAETICIYYIQLFRQPEFLFHRFSTAQLEGGFWAIQSANLNCGLQNLLGDTDLPFAAREDCIRAMADLFKHLFAIESLDTAVYMWWDSLCYDWHSGNRDRKRGGEDQRLQDVLFETLAQILLVDSETCQTAALHGLGHLHHPDTPALIENYLNEHPSFTQELKTYALAAAKFEVM